ASVTSPSIFPLSLRKADSGDPVVIACLIKGFFPLGFPEPVKVTWGKSGVVTNYLPSEAGGLYTVISQLSLRADQCPDDASVKCEVQHYTSPSKSVDVPCIVCPPPPPCPCECLLSTVPRLSLSPPAEDLLLSSNASLTCTLRGLRDPKGATFTWSPSSGNVPVLQEPKLEPSGCYSVSSVLPGCAEPWSKKETFSCTASHPELKKSQTVSITKPKEPLFQPQVHVLPPPSEELALNELVTLTCLVRGFSPKEVLVLWLQGHEKLPREKYLVFKPLREPGQSVPTFAVTSLLRVEAEAWLRGDVFSCMVGHEALPLSFTQKSIDRLSGKPTHVNVSVVMAEADGTCY
nr:RecName: Full=Immunoglobulin heavy constant alpha; AltName: Full=Ig alpha chain C region; AltName: Full=IgA constant region [Equus asinus]